ncbi:TIGR04282 family arsenosugar biosynthesis glycosyltransferase [Methyloglobulus sp.]|uniref:TIGR04282 family arsenosugar biosynthesis glycosyltransferase n=1 Tax=Methyloglobulus sp. TaxID=2518622 RepID=UPI0032B83E43
MYAYPDAVIMVFCKAPIPGQVKTRLIPALTSEEAAQLHCELTELTLHTATQKRLCEVHLWCSPRIDHPFFKALSQRYSIARQLQQGKDLGNRMHHAFVETLTHFSSAIIIGCDCPSLTSDDIEQALVRLNQDTQCVLAPAEDGGYVLIGLKQPQPTLFENMPWGSDQVLRQTLTRIQSLNLVAYELNTQWDLDTIDDLKRYRHENV